MNTNRITNVKYVAMANWFLKNLQNSNGNWLSVDFEKLIRKLPKSLLKNRDTKCPTLEQVPLCLMHLTDALASLQIPLIIAEFPTDSNFDEIEGMPYLITYAPAELECLLIPQDGCAITAEILDTEPPEPERKSKAKSVSTSTNLPISLKSIACLPKDKQIELATMAWRNKPNLNNTIMLLTVKMSSRTESLPISELYALATGKKWGALMQTKRDKIIEGMLTATITN